ncbi:hypothetical protein CSB37_02680 [bacterium DOLZORAL124_38_8]|nr:MAG: hypothetical protein CSB37_02680 [bacterium DOLZORAL124_38_8]
MAHIQLRINYEDKQAAQAVLDSLGLTMSGAIKLFLKQVVREQALPFSVSVGGNTVKSVSQNKPAVSENKMKEWSGFAVKKIGE